MTYGGRVFIGGISADVSKDDIGNAFSKYGKLRTVWVASKPPGFAFVEYDDNRDAEEAVKKCNGVSLFNENKIKVEISKKRPGPPGGGRVGGGMRSGPMIRSGGSGGPIRSSNPNFRGNSPTLFKPRSRYMGSSNNSSSRSGSGAPRIMDQGQRGYSSRGDERISSGGTGGPPPRFSNSDRFSSQSSRFPSSRPSGGAPRFGGSQSGGYKGGNFRNSRPMD